MNLTGLDTYFKVAPVTSERSPCERLQVGWVG